jgi:pumilio RNA-binding family
MFFTYSCRVIQKALLVLDQVSVCKIITELQDIEEVIPFIFDPNGNHVIQRAIQIMSNFSISAADQGDIDAAVNIMNQINFIIDDVAANVEQLSKHRYGCRVVQRAIEYCPKEHRDKVLVEILACHPNLIEDQFGNYVIQQALVIGSEDLLTAVVSTLTRNDLIFTFSRHKYASNVVETMLTSATAHHKEAILNAMLKVRIRVVWSHFLLFFYLFLTLIAWHYYIQDFEGSCGIVKLAKDPIANYVVKKTFDCAEGQQREKLFAVITSNRQQLSQSPYAKYVLVKLGERRPSKAGRRSKGQDTTSGKP